jgi:hypothetical protein
VQVPTVLVLIAVFALVIVAVAVLVVAIPARSVRREGKMTAADRARVLLGEIDDPETPAAR